MQDPWEFDTGIDATSLLLGDTPNAQRGWMTTGVANQGQVNHGSHRGGGSGPSAPSTPPATPPASGTPSLFPDSPSLLGPTGGTGGAQDGAGHTKKDKGKDKGAGAAPAAPSARAQAQHAGGSEWREYQQTHGNKKVDTNDVGEDTRRANGEQDGTAGRTWVTKDVAARSREISKAVEDGTLDRKDAKLLSGAKGEEAVRESKRAAHERINQTRECVTEDTIASRRTLIALLENKVQRVERHGTPGELEALQEKLDRQREHLQSDAGTLVDQDPDVASEG